MPDFDISSTTTSVVPEVLSVLAILSAITTKRLAVEQEVRQKYLKMK